MVEAQVMEPRVIIVADIRRERLAGELLNNFRWDACAVFDYDQRGALTGHIEAIEAAGKLGWRCIIMEDDAIPVVGFLDRAQAWFDRFPDDLISFYLGTGRPRQMQPMVDTKLGAAKAIDRDWITMPTLIHGVCYSIPPAKIPDVLDRLAKLRDHIREADYAIGAAWGRPVIYAVESLAEHRDGPVVERHPDGQPRVERRVARRLAGPLMYPGDS